MVYDVRQYGLLVVYYESLPFVISFVDIRISKYKYSRLDEQFDHSINQLLLTSNSLQLTLFAHPELTPIHEPPQSTYISSIIRLNITLMALKLKTHIFN